jgi:hypothetical protein
VTEEGRRQRSDPRNNWVPPGVDTDSPNAARMYDYFLGGARNFAADRELAEKVMQVIPAAFFAQTNRGFLWRAVEFLVREAGIRQFIDLGSGIPTLGNVHEVAQSAAPDCRIAYVDNDPVAVAHSQLLLEGNGRAATIEADLRDTGSVLTHPDVRGMIDFDTPMAVLMCAVLHFVPDKDDPASIVAAYRDALMPGSYLVLTHATADYCPDDLARAVGLYENTPTPATLRTHEQVRDLFDGFRLVSPGVVHTPVWRPDGHQNGIDPRRSLCYGGVAVL